MLRDANFCRFKAVYVVCGRVDLRYGIDSLAALVENRYHMQMFVPNTLFLFCGRGQTKSRAFYGKAMVFFSFTNA